MKATIRLFGQFRNHAQEPWLELELDPGASALEAKAALGRKLFGTSLSAENHSLLDASALASASEVLAGDAALAPLADPCGKLELAILPPVCGG